MTLRTASEHSRAIGMLILANLFWGLSFPLIKGLGLAHAALDPSAPEALLTVYTVAPRFVLAVLVVAVWRWRDRRTAKAASQLTSSPDATPATGAPRARPSFAISERSAT